MLTTLFHFLRALDYPTENGAYLQMRLSYSPVAHLFLFLVQWTDCHLAGALGLLRILIYMVHVFPSSVGSVFSCSCILFCLHRFALSSWMDLVVQNDLFWVCGLMQNYADGKTTMSVYERKASIRDFYGAHIYLEIG